MWLTCLKCLLTSACIQQLGPLDEAQVASPGPQSVGLPKAESGVEVVCLQALLPIDGVVATGAVRAIHPDLHKDRKVNEQGLEYVLNEYLWDLYNVSSCLKKSKWFLCFTLCQWEYLIHPRIIKRNMILFAHSPPQDGNPPAGLWSLGSRWWPSPPAGS